MGHSSVKHIQRIAIVGAGPGGVAAAKYVGYLSVAYTSLGLHINRSHGFYDQPLIGNFQRVFGRIKWQFDRYI